MYISEVNLKRVLASYALSWDDNETGMHDNNDAISLGANLVAKLFNISEHDLHLHMVQVITNDETPKPQWGEALLKSIKAHHKSAGKVRR